MGRDRDDPPRWWLAGEDTGALRAHLDGQVAALSGGNGHGPSPAANDRPLATVAGRGPARLGIVDPDERKVELARHLLADGTPWRGRSDVWFTPAGLVAGGGTEPAGKLAFLFPGVEPTFEAEATNLTALGERLGLEVPPLDDATVAHQSASIYRLGIFLDLALRRLGVEPGMVAGHSIGEWSGAVAAGIVPRERANELLDALAVDLDQIRLPNVDFAALAAGAETVQPLLAGFEGGSEGVVMGLDGVVVSHDNCPRQSVICGPPEQIDAALARFRELEILGFKLPFQSGFHTPAVAPLVEAFRAQADRLPFVGGRSQMWSATSIAPYPGDREEIVELGLRHLVEPVRFRPLIRRLYEEAGARVFVQVGLGSLTGFVNDTLQDADHAAIPVLTGKRSALAQMHRALTALWVEGVEVAPDALQGPVPMPVQGAPSVPVALQDTPPVPAHQAREAIALIAAATWAAQEVLGALTTRFAASSVPAAAVGPGLREASETRQQPPPEPAAPSRLQQPVAPQWPSGRVTFTRRISLETMPETLDHTLTQLPEGWPDPSDAFPIVAMTTQIQMLQDIAASYATDREVVEVSGIRNVRWLDLSDPQDVEVAVTPRNGDVLHIALGGYCRAALRAGRFAPAPRYEAPPLSNPRPTKYTAEELFGHGLMFHGPRFQGITSMGPIGDDGMLGDFRHLETPGSLLDNLGKLIAYWVIDNRTIAEGALPIGVDRIGLFGPDPAPGTPIRCDIRIVELQRDLVRADGVLVLPDGAIWCRVEGWASIVFHMDELTEPAFHRPDRSFLGEPQPGGWNVVRERWPTGPGREFAARRFLRRDERATYEQLNLMEQRRWIIDRTAVKESVRQWLWDTYQTPSYPVEIYVTPESRDRFRVESPRIPEGHDLRVTLSTLEWLAVAIVADGGYRDIEAREVCDGDDPQAVARLAAEVVGARNPGATVAHVAEPENVVPQWGELPGPPIAVAWTA